MNDKTVLLICIILVLLGFNVYLALRLSQIKKVRDEGVSEVKSLKKKLGAVQLDYVETKLNSHLFKNILNSV